MKIHTIDLNFNGVPGAIACFILESEAGPILIETGPHSCLKVFEAEAAKLGYSLTDFKHVIVTHIHLDHAGAAWSFAENGATIYVHPLGAKHLSAPEKLYNSAKRIYKDKMHTLWGDLNPIDPERIVLLKDKAILKIGNLAFVAHYSPGHAVHHLCIEYGSALFAGDVAGVRIAGGPVQAPCPPPDISLEDWKKSIAKMKDIAPSQLYLTHFGMIDDPIDHLNRLERNIENWALWVRENAMEEEINDQLISAFESFAYRDDNGNPLNGEVLEQYIAANPAWMSVYGLKRYWQLKLS